MKRHLCILLSFLMAFTLLIGCGTKSSPKDEIKLNIATASIPRLDDSLNDLNATANMSISSYLVSRSYFEMICNYDIENGSAEELEDLIKKAIKSFENSEMMSSNLSSMADITEKTFSSPSVKGKYEEAKAALEDSKSFENPFVLKVYADEKSDALAEAQRIVDIYDNAPNMQGIKTLASQLNTDSKHAYATLKQSLAILEGNEYEKLADKEQSAINTCITLKAAGTTAGFAISIMTSGGATTAFAKVMESGGIILNEVNTICEVGTATSTIITGSEKNCVARGFTNLEDKLAPASSIMGLYGCATTKISTDMEIHEIFNFVSFGVPEIYSGVTDGKILGGLIDFNSNDNSLDVTFTSAKAGENSDSASSAFNDISNEIKLPSSVTNKVNDVLVNDFDEVKNANLGDEDFNKLYDEIIDLNAACDPNSDEYACDDVMSDIYDDVKEIANEESIDISEYEIVDDFDFDDYDYESDYDDSDYEKNPFSDMTVVIEDVPSDYDDGDLAVVESGGSDSDDYDTDGIDGIVDIEDETDVSDSNPNGIPTIDEICGYYDYWGVDFNGDDLHFSNANITKSGTGAHIVDTMLDGEFDLPYNNGILYIEEDGASATYSFWKENGIVKSKLVMSFGELGTFDFYATKQ